MMEPAEAARHYEEKGLVLTALKQDFSREMTSVRSLASALALLGRPMTKQGLQFALVYLAEAEYVKIWRVEDMPGFRADRMSEQNVQTVVFARLLPKGLHLIDGLIPADPSVIF